LGSTRERSDDVLGVNDKNLITGIVGKLTGKALTGPRSMTFEGDVKKNLGYIMVYPAQPDDTAYPFAIDYTTQVMDYDNPRAHIKQYYLMTSTEWTTCK
jgi:hypothetical protein